MNKTLFELSDKVIIVTGAASGIGRASVVRFTQAGAKVIACDIDNDVDQVVSSINEQGGEAVSMVVDASSDCDVEKIIAFAEEKYGRLDVFFANAGIGGKVYGGIFDASTDDWQDVLKVNLVGPYLAIKHAAPLMKKTGKGSIICTASVAGLRSGAGPAQYSASKAGVINLVKTAAQQLKGTNIRVNAICPGLINTEMTKPIYDMAKEKGVEDKIGYLNPMLRDGRPEEIASAAHFLASDAASYVNGTALVVDGGLSSSHPFGAD